MPRLTSMSGFSSRAMRRAMSVGASMSDLPGGYQVIDNRSRRHDVIGRDKTNRHDVIGTGDNTVSRHRDKRIEVAGGQHIGKIAEVIGHECVDQREIRLQRKLDQISRAVDFELLLAVLDDRANPSWRQHAAQPIAAGANALDQRALGHKLHDQVAAQHLLLGFRIKPDMAGDDPVHEPGADQLPDAFARHCRVVRDHRQMALLLADELIDQTLGGTDSHEATDGKACAVGNFGNSVLEMYGLHILLPLCRYSFPGTAQKRRSLGKGRTLARHCAAQLLASGQQRLFIGRPWPESWPDDEACPARAAEPVRTYGGSFRQAMRFRHFRSGSRQDREIAGRSYWVSGW